MDNSLIHLLRWAFSLFIIVLIILSITFSLILAGPDNFSKIEKLYHKDQSKLINTEVIERVKNPWLAPLVDTIQNESDKKLIEYGKELIANTSKYLGPKGTINQISNGLNCQNCHLEAGTKVWGNNYGKVFRSYPKFRARSGTVESIEKRINDCFERSLNGSPLSDDSRELLAMASYINWLGKDTTKSGGIGIVNLPELEREASIENGYVLYQSKCSSCHGVNGEGQISNEGNFFTYPALWGNNSYNNGAGLYRLSRFAGYIKANMPLGANYDNPQLTNEEAWDIAAYVNSMPRPKKDLTNDWPDISKKPIDHPFGPYADNFSERQHKYGPYQPIKNFYKKSQ